MTIDVLYRLNPDVAPETQAGLAVGAGATKFGMTETEIGAAITAGGGPDGPLRPRGIHLHVGSQLGAVDAWRDAVRKGLALTALWRGTIPTFDTLDVGGGFPVAPDRTQPAPDTGTLRPRAAGAAGRHPGRPPARPAWPSSPGGRSSPVPAGWSRACSMPASAAGARSSSMPA